MSRSKVFFIGINSVTAPFVDAVAQESEVIVSNISFPANIKSQYKRFVVKHSFFGLDTIFRKVLNSQVSWPFYQSGLGKLLKQTNPDTIVCMDFFRFWFLQALWYKLRHPNTKLIVHSETKIVPTSLLSKVLFYPMLWLFKAFQSKVSRIIVFCQSGKNFWLKHVKGDVQICPAPIDEKLFHSIGERTFLQNEELRIVVNARLVPYKNHMHVLETMKLLVHEGKKVRALFIGAESAYTEYLKMKVDEFGLKKYTEIRSNVPQAELNQLYTSYDVLVLASYNDAIGMVVPEALNTGLPVVVSDTCGAAEYVKEGVNGYIFKTGDVQGLKQILLGLYSEEKLKGLSSKAKEIMMTQFSHDSLNQKFISAIR